MDGAKLTALANRVMQLEDEHLKQYAELFELQKKVHSNESELIALREVLEKLCEFRIPTH